MQQYDAFAINRSKEIQNRRQFPMKMDLFGPINGKRMVLVVICTMMIVLMICGSATARQVIGSKPIWV